MMIEIHFYTAKELLVGRPPGHLKKVKVPLEEEKAWINYLVAKIEEKYRFKKEIEFIFSVLQCAFKSCRKMAGRRPKVCLQLNSP